VGDPWKIAEIALVESSLKLHALIVIVDVSRICALLNDARVADTVRNQLMRCNIVLLNKTDLALGDEIDRARQAICTVRGNDARIALLSKNSIPTLETFPQMTGRSGFYSQPISPVTDHEAQFSRWVYQRKGAFDRMRFATAIASLPDEVLRLKGECRFSDGEMAAEFQMVEKVWSLSSRSDAIFSHDITLVGVGTLDMPPAEDLDRILDGALAA
jgi:G3E family GTPase